MPGFTSVSNSSASSSRRTRTAPISQIRLVAAERPVVSRSKTTSSASSSSGSGRGSASETTASEPLDARVAGDDLRDERAGEPLRKRPGREQHACRLARAERRRTLLEQLDETVDGVEGELHPHMESNIRSLCKGRAPGHAFFPQKCEVPPRSAPLNLSSPGVRVALRRARDTEDRVPGSRNAQAPGWLGVGLTSYRLGAFFVPVPAVAPRASILPAMLDARWASLIAVCTAVFMLLLDITIVNVALPNMQRSLHASFTQLQWVIDAYTLSLASLTLNGGALADPPWPQASLRTRGSSPVHRRLAPRAASPRRRSFLIVARGAAGRRRRDHVRGDLARAPDAGVPRPRARPRSASGAARSARPAPPPPSSAASLLTTCIGWRWIFFVNVPLGAIAIVLTPR